MLFLYVRRCHWRPNGADFMIGCSFGHGGGRSELFRPPLLQSSAIRGAGSVVQPCFADSEVRNTVSANNTAHTLVISWLQSS